MAIALAICGVAVFILVWRLVAEGRLIATPFLLFSVLEVATVWPALVFAESLGVSDDNYGAFVGITCYIAFVVGYLLTISGLDHSASALLRYRAARATRADEDWYYPFTLLLGAFLCAGGLYLYQGLPQLVDTVGAFVGSGGGDEASILMSLSRETVTKGHFFGGEYRGQGVFRALMIVGWPFLIGLCLTLHHETRDRKWAILAGVFAAPAIMFIAGDGTRSRLVMAIAQLAVTMSLVKKVRLRTLLVLVGLFFLAFFAMSTLTTKAANIDTGGRGLTATLGEAFFDRIMYGNGINNVHIIEFVREGVLTHRWGMVQFDKLVAVLPGVSSDRTPFAHELYLLISGGGRLTTFASPTNFGRIFLDFGWLGAAITYTLTGALVAGAEFHLFRSAKTALRVPLVGFLIFELGLLSLGGLPGILPAVMVMGAIYAGAVAFRHVYRGRRRRP